jgi:hypothetical protein
MRPRRVVLEVKAECAAVTWPADPVRWRGEEPLATALARAYDSRYSEGRLGRRDDEGRWLCSAVVVVDRVRFYRQHARCRGDAGWGGSAGDIEAEGGSGAAVAGSSAEPGGRPGFAGDTGSGGSAGSGAGSAGQGESGSAGEGGEAGMGSAVCAIVAARYCDAL